MKKKNKDKGKGLLTIWGEYLAVRAFTAILRVMPERAAVLLGRALGNVAWRVYSDKRILARQNIQKAMPELHPDEVDRLTRKAFVNISLNAVEMLWSLKRLDKAHVERRMVTSGLDAVRGQLAEGRAVLAFTLHLGNWEFAGSAMSILLGGLSAVAKPAGNPLLERLLDRHRRRVGIRALSTAEGIRPVVAAIKEGRLVAILMDQHVRTACTAASFFGREAATTTVPAALALKFHLPVFLACSFRHGETFRHTGLADPVELIRTGDYEADVRTNTQLFNDKLEQVIRQHPEQWLWPYRRWRTADKREEREKLEKENASLVE